MKKVVVTVLVLAVLSAIFVLYVKSLPRESPPVIETSRNVLAGWRSSIYGYQQEQPPQYWVDAAKDLSSKVGGTPSGIWIIGDVQEDGSCNLEFPGNGSYKDITFSDTDMVEEYLDAFDSSGTKIWLQVEPGNADVGALIDIVLSRYSRHPSVIGFGVDVEWLQSMAYTDGRPVTNSEAISWLEKVKSYNPNYRLFLKHWLKEKMPSKHPEGIVFVSDSQGFQSYGEMMDDFSSWGKSFSDAKVAYQYGYEADRVFWGSMDDPFSEMGIGIMRNITNCVGLYWVDFTIKELYR